MARFIGDHEVLPQAWPGRFAIGDEIYTITDLGQVRVLADPFRLRLLSAFGAGSRTTKQVAQQLGEKPTKLYHHVEALERVGLLILKETRPNRGTLEKYYEAVATRFQIGGDLFSSAPAAEPIAGETAAMLMSILDTTCAELAVVLNRGADSSHACPANTAMVARMLLRGEPAQIAQFRARLLALLDQFKAETAGLDPGEADAYGLTLAFYQVPLAANAGKPHEPSSPAVGKSTTIGRAAQNVALRAAQIRRRAASEFKGFHSRGEADVAPESLTCDSRRSAGHFDRHAEKPVFEMPIPRTIS